MNAIAERLNIVERQLEALQREVDELRALAASEPEPEPELPPEPAPIVPPPPQPAMWPPASPQPQTAWPAPREPRQRPSARRIALPQITAGDLMGARTLALAGGIVTLLGVVLLFVLAVNRGWIGPTERVAFGAAASVVAVALGFLVRSRYGQYHSALAAVGAGIAGGYATLLAAVVLYDLGPEPVALAIAAGIAAVGVAISLLWNAQLVAALGLVGATLAPGTVALDSGITTAGTAFAAFVFAGTAIVALARDWRPLLVCGVLASAPQAAALALSEPDRVTGAVAVTLGFGALYLAAGILVQLRSARGELDRLAGALVLLSATLSFASAAVLLHGTAENAVLLSVAAVYGALTTVLFTRDRELAAVLAVAALTLAAIALAAGHALLIDATPEQLYEDVADPAHGIAAPVAVLVALLAVAAATRTWHAVAGRGLVERLVAPLAPARGPLAVGLVWAAGVLAAYSAALGLLALVGDFDWAHVGVAALWAVAGAALLIVSTRLQHPGLRLGGALWLAVIAVHMVWFDLTLLDDPQRGWAALALAVPALAGAYVVGLFETRSPVWVLGVLLSAGMGAIAAVELAAPGNATGFSLLGAAAAYGALAATVFSRSALRNLSSLLWMIGLAFALGAVPILLEGTALVAAWAGAAAALALLALLAREARFQVACLAFLTLALGYTLAVVAPPADLFEVNADPGAGAPAAFLVAVAALVVALLARAERLRELDLLDSDLRSRQPQLRTGAAWTAGVFGLYGLSLAVLGVVAWLSEKDVETEFQRGHTTVSAVWGTVGLVLLYLGLQRGWRALRGAGFALFGISLAKIFLYDLSQLSSIARAASFLAVGALLLTAGFFYQRLSRPTI